MKLLKSASALALALPLFAPAAMAYEAGDMVFRAGVTHVETDGKGDVFSGGADTTLDAGVNDDTQLGLNFVYFYTPKWAVEVLAATPFEHDIKLSNGTKFADAKQLPPTVSVLYYFNNSQSAFQPYAGVGVNYTTFFEEKLTDDAKSSLNANSLKLDDSWGLAAQVGFDYQLNERWMVNASVRYIDIDTTAHFDLGSTDSKVDVDIDPWVSSLMIGYRF